MQAWARPQRQRRQRECCSRGAAALALRRIGTLGLAACGQLHGPERLAIYFAGGQTRHLFQALVARRHHIGRQARGQGRTQRGLRGAGRAGAPAVRAVSVVLVLLSVVPTACFAWARPAVPAARIALDRFVVSAAFVVLTRGRHPERRQLIHARFLAQHHGGCAYAGLLGQHRLDLAQFDAEAADLHLVIGPAQAVHLVAGVDAGQVAGAVQAPVMFIGRPGVGQEFLARQIGPPQVAGRHAGAGDAQFACLSMGQNGQSAFGGQFGVHYQQAVVGQRLADGHRLARLEPGQAGRHGGLGGAVGIEQLALGRGPALHQVLGAHFPAQVDDAQARHVLAEQRQQGGHGVQHGDLLGRERPRQGLRVGGQFFRGDPERGAGQVADPDFFERHVESHREALVYAVALLHPQHRVLAAQEVADTALGDHNAFGLAGGARGIYDVGRVVGAYDAAAAQRRGGRSGGIGRSSRI